MKQYRFLSLKSLRAAMVGVTLFIGYGALYPFQPLVIPSVSIWQLLCSNAVNKVFLFDVIQNLLFFIPLGMVGIAYVQVLEKPRSWLFVMCFGAGLSILVESLQCYLPMRVPSLLDILLNIISTGLGIIFFYFLSRQRVFSTTRWLPVIGLGSWILSQSAPWLPSLDPYQLQHAITIEFHTWFLEEWLIFFSYSLQGLLLASTIQNTHLGEGGATKCRAWVIKLPILFLLIWFASQILVVRHQLDLPTTAGLLLGIILGSGERCSKWLAFRAAKLLLVSWLIFVSILVTPWHIVSESSIIFYLQLLFWLIWLGISLI